MNGWVEWKTCNSKLLNDGFLAQNKWDKIISSKKVRENGEKELKK